MHYLNSLEAINTSNKRMKDFVQGNFKDQLPPTGTFLYVDVRDVALAHVKAIEVPEAGGKRFFVTAGYFTNKDVADAIRQTHPQLESKLPPKDAPSDLPAGIYGFDNSRSRELLGLTYTPWNKTVGDTAESILAVGA